MRKIILTFITIFAMVTMIACTPKNDEQLTLLNNFADTYTFDTSLKNDQLDIPEMVDIAGLGTVFLSFTSSDSLVIDEDGKVFRKEVAQDVTVEVTFKYQSLVTKRTYALTVEKIVTYTITFISESDTVIESQRIHQGALVNKPDDLVKTGYTFLGWFLDDLAFDFNTPVTKDMTLTARWQKDEVEAYYTLSFETNSLTIIESQTVRKNENFTKPDDPIKEGYIFDGWYLDPTLDTPFDFNMPATMDLTIYAKYIYEDVPLAPAESGAYFEAIYAIWDDKDAFNANVYYKASSNTEWLRVDQALIRQISESNARVDVVGIQAGYYDIKIETSTHQTLVVQELYTARNDRSGYAHFNYNEGIGGYNDDGTLKENAIVVYVTEANKNDIEIPGIGQKGLGWILNNNQYFSSQSNTHSTANQLSSLAFFNQPIVFRIIGKVTAPEGLTVYNSTNQGGSVGDNGQMARIRNANHMTIEGIGEDAEIYGWGIHFMAMSEGRGIGFEVKNLTFRHYPEDALGLEGVQSNNVLTIPVQRGWIHHVTFYEGYHPNPAESDKANGDGSLDIKRGQYFTVAYNQFLGAHKTNLVGSSNSSLQYHITYHHNHWQNNASRIPL
ncbi:MAG TPA: hypothetical protein GX698_00145, partial [Acholeplasmataceae bacterium]|nr:hypothetical protein [Acholeplasmataceae bacterium]